MLLILEFVETLYIAIRAGFVVIVGAIPLMRCLPLYASGRSRSGTAFTIITTNARIAIVNYVISLKFAPRAVSCS
jgi:hypothetical protein